MLENHQTGGVGMLSKLIVASVAAMLVAIPAQAASFKIFGGMGSGSSPSDESMVPRNLRMEIVAFNRALPPGSILVETSKRRLFFVLENGKAMSYPVGVGREGHAWSGTNVITRKAEWPDWRPPEEMLKREAERGRFLPRLVKGGPQNPLGARALYIGDTLYRIHGTSSPWTVGRASSSGCIRMLNEHVIELSGLAQVGAKVVVE
jgi:lipoprotein-anchoring transpeptidase ErfK/SrfK